MLDMESRGRVGGKLERAGVQLEFVAVGHLAADLRKGERLLGGAAAYGALTASRLGLATALVTAVGEDFDLFEPLDGIEIYFQRVDRSTSFENLYLGSERRQRLLGRAGPLKEADLSPLRPKMAEDAIVFYCPIAREVEAPLRPLTTGGICGVAPQGFFRQWDTEGWVCPSRWDGATEALAGAEVVSLSEKDPPDLSEFVRAVAGKVPLLAVTEAERGSRLYTEGRCYRLPAYPCREADPTGAGDVYAAALLVALREGREPLEAGQFASSAASFAVERVGLEGVPEGYREVEDRLARYRELYHPEEVPR